MEETGRWVSGLKKKKKNFFAEFPDFSLPCLSHACILGVLTRMQVHQPLIPLSDPPAPGAPCDRPDRRPAFMKSFLSDPALC